MSEAPTINMAEFDPRDLALEDIDISQRSLWIEDKKMAFFDRLRDEAPVHFCKDSEFGSYWSVTRYKDILEVDSNWQDFSSEPAITIVEPEEDFPLPMFIAMDPPVHDDQRKTVQRSVAPANLKFMEETIRSRTQKVLDDLPVGEQFDWVDRVSIELTTQMLATLFDFPFEDRRKLTRWSDVATGDEESGIVESEEARQAELYECLEYFTKLWNERAERGESNDLVSMLAHGEATKNMTPQEYLGNLILLIVGGNDTTRNSMTGGVWALNQNSGEYAKLRNNPGVIPSMVSEIIRWQTPLAHMRRIANKDYELGGQTIRAGDKVIMWYLSGNRDERAIENPNEFIIDRPKARQHLSFGFGVHRCMGNRLAEMQLRILWEEIQKRFHRVEVIGEPKLVPSNFVHGYTEMQVVLHPH